MEIMYWGMLQGHSVGFHTVIVITLVQRNKGGKNVRSKYWFLDEMSVNF